MGSSKDVDATNRDFLAYDQVEKDQRYRLAESDGEELFDDAYRIRTCRLGDRDFAAQLGAALSEIGFAIVEGTGIDPALYDEAEARVIRMFEGLAADDKLQFSARRHGAVNQGYFPIKQTSGIHPDLVEGWVFCRRAFALPGEPAPDLAAFWPCTDDEPFFRRLCLAHEALIIPITRALMAYLGQPPTAFDDRVRGTNFGLRLNYYPPIAEGDRASGAGRLLGHEDVTFFTMLPAPRIEGLQVLNRANRRWVRLDAPRGALILNTGDYMQRISNDRLPSTTHRVAKPRDPALLGQPRASFPLNVYLREDEMLEVLPGLGDPHYPPVRALTFHTRTTAKYYGDDYAVE